MNDKQLQRELAELFARHGAHVAVGLKPGGGVVIRSQDPQVDVANVGCGFKQTGSQR